MLNVNAYKQNLCILILTLLVNPLHITPDVAMDLILTLLVNPLHITPDVAMDFHRCKQLNCLRGDTVVSVMPE